MKICPYCNGETNIKNLNIDHKFKHEVLGCNKTYKKCFTCGTQYSESNQSDLDNTVVVNDIFEVDFCNVCNEWLPDFPTSWIRSFTNLSKIYEFLKDVYKNKGNVINSRTLMIIQRRHNGVVFNIERAKERGTNEYITGAPLRRMNEYFGILKNMGLIKFKDDLANNSKMELTLLGEELLKATDSQTLLSCFILGFINMKLDNGFQKNIKSSCYNRFKIRFTENILQTVHHLNGHATKYQIALSVLARNKTIYKNICIKKLNEFSSESIKDMYFKNSKEVDRGVKSTFINMFCELGILSRDHNFYSITGFGKSLLQFINARPSIWFDDVRELSILKKVELDYSFSSLIIWRLHKNGLIKDEEISTEIKLIAQDFIEHITGMNINDINDIQINAFYDIPMLEPTLLTAVRIKTMDLLDNRYDNEELGALLDILGYIWLDDILKIVVHHDEVTTDFELKFNNEFKSNVQSGRKWHETVKEQFLKLKLNVVDYKDSPIFSGIQIDQLKIFLPGGTLYNPDMIIKDVNFGPQNCILIDAKDENSISEEVSKLFGYNIYSSNIAVNTYTIIALRGTLPRTAARRIEQELSSFSRITIIEEEALYKLANQKLTNEQLLDILIPTYGFKLIDKNNF